MKLVKPEKSQTYLVCRRINCSVVSRSVLFEEQQQQQQPLFTPFSTMSVTF